MIEHARTVECIEILDHCERHDSYIEHHTALDVDYRYVWLYNYLVPGTVLLRKWYGCTWYHYTTETSGTCFYRYNVTSTGTCTRAVRGISTKGTGTETCLQACMYLVSLRQAGGEHVSQISNTDSLACTLISWRHQYIVRGLQCTR